MLRRFPHQLRLRSQGHLALEIPFAEGGIAHCMLRLDKSGVLFHVEMRSHFIACSVLAKVGILNFFTDQFIGRYPDETAVQRLDSRLLFACHPAAHVAY